MNPNISSSFSMIFMPYDVGSSYFPLINGLIFLDGLSSFSFQILDVVLSFNWIDLFSFVSRTSFQKLILDISSDADMKLLAFHLFHYWSNW